MKKLEWLCEHSKFTTMRAVAERTERIHSQRAFGTRVEGKDKPAIVAIGASIRPTVAYEKVEANQKRDIK